MENLFTDWQIPHENQQTKEQHEYVQGLNQAIIEESQFEKFGSIVLMDLPVGAYTYLDYCDVDADNKSTPKSIGIKPYTKFVQVENYRVACTMTQEQVQDIDKQWGIDVKALVFNALKNEASLTIRKKLMHKIEKLSSMSAKDEYTFLDKCFEKIYNIFKKTYIKKIKVREVNDIIRRIVRESNKIMVTGRRGPGTFAICSPKTGAMLQSSSEYVFANDSERKMINGGEFYPIGTIAGIIVYVNPYMLNTDNTVYVGRCTTKVEPGLKLCFYKTGTTSTMTVTGVGAPKLVLNLRFTIVETGEPSNIYYRKFTYNDKHIKL